MHVFGAFKTRVAHRRAHPCGDRVNLREASQMLIRQPRAARAAHRQCAGFRGLVNDARFEHEKMRRQAALRAA